jgi:hypothetical protein
VLKFINFRFALFTPSLGDFQYPLLECLSLDQVSTLDPQGWTIRAKEEARGLKGALKMWWLDQLSEDVAEIVSIGQLSPGTKTIQYGVLYLTNQEVNNIKL